MRNLALSVAAILVLAVASPAFAQPFADVPTDHWAFDAIAELAAKGIIEGFPDGTFKGDHGHLVPGYPPIALEGTIRKAFDDTLRGELSDRVERPVIGRDVRERLSKRRRDNREHEDRCN